MTDPLDIADELHAVAASLADAARSAILPYFRAPGLSIDSKGAEFDPVTEADRAAERAMWDILATARPRDAILGEEFGHQPGENGLTWILDPIDGTRGFLSGTPTWGVLIALADDRGPRLGLIDQPFIGERFIGGLGRATYQGPSGAQVLGARAPRPLQEAVLFSTFPEIGSRAERDRFERVANRVKLVRYGMDCYAYALLAAGQIDLVIEAGLQSYDVAAPIALIEAAGGIVTDWTGGPADAGGQVLAAANPAVHRAALELLS